MIAEGESQEERWLGGPEEKLSRLEKESRSNKGGADGQITTWNVWGHC